MSETLQQEPPSEEPMVDGDDTAEVATDPSQQIPGGVDVTEDGNQESMPDPNNADDMRQAVSGEEPEDEEEGNDEDDIDEEVEVQRQEEYEHKIAMATAGVDPAWEHQILQDIDAAEEECERAEQALDEASEEKKQCQKRYDDSVDRLRKLIRERRQPTLFNQPAPSDKPEATKPQAQQPTDCTYADQAIEYGRRRPVSELLIPGSIVKKLEFVKVPTIGDIYDHLAGQNASEYKIAGLPDADIVTLFQAMEKIGCKVEVDAGKYEPTWIEDQLPKAWYEAVTPKSEQVQPEAPASPSMPDSYKEEAKALEEKYLQTRIADLGGLSERQVKLLEEAEIRTVSELMARTKERETWWYKDIKGFGEGAAEKLDEALLAHWGRHSNELKAIQSRHGIADGAEQEKAA